MVLINYKKTDYNQFLFEITAKATIDEVVAQLVEVNNLRVVLDRLCTQIEDLAKHGPLKPEEHRGLTFDMIPDKNGKLPEPGTKEEIKLAPGQRYNEDPTKYRTGIIPAEDICKMLNSEVAKAKKVISKERFTNKECLTALEIKEAINNLRGAVMIAYPAYHGLPDWEPVKMIMENKFEFELLQNENFDYLNEKDTSIWWAGKELQSGKTLADYVGKNEKTKIVVKLQKSGQGAPAREPMIDQKSYTNMLSYYKKKEEEMKKLETDNDDSYLNAPWANPNNLKGQLLGTGNIQWKPK